MEEDEMEEEEDVGGASRGKRGAPCVRLREGQSLKRRCTRPHSLDLGTLLSHRQEHTRTVRRTHTHSPSHTQYVTRTHLNVWVASAGYLGLFS